jgi:hypothetical protein
MKLSDKFADCSGEQDKSKQYVAVEGGTIIESRIPAMVYDVEDSVFGYKKKDWDKVKKTLDSNKLVGRKGYGEKTDLDEASRNMDKFTPMYLSAEDGGVIDLDNKARMKGTLTGAGIGGGVGAFTAYQGAQTEIDERWVAAVREYKDSLQKFYCGTGTRFLSFYNDTIVLPKQTQ